MPVLIATITPTEGNHDRVQSIISRAIPEAQAHSGCLTYSLLANKRVFVILERWDSRESLQAWAASDALHRLHDDLEPLVETLDRNFVVVEPISVGDPSKSF